MDVSTAFDKVVLENKKKCVNFLQAERQQDGRRITFKMYYRSSIESVAQVN